MKELLLNEETFINFIDKQENVKSICCLILKFKENEIILENLCEILEMCCDDNIQNEYNRGIIVDFVLSRKDDFQDSRGLNQLFFNLLTNYIHNWTKEQNSYFVKIHFKIR